MKSKRETKPGHREGRHASPFGVLRVAVGAGLLFSLALACSSADQVSEKSKRLAHDLSQRPADAGEAPASSPSSSARPRVYIDASLSMSGYVLGTPGGRTTFETFLDKLPEYMPGCEAYKFGQGGEQELLSPASFDMRLHSPGFYDLIYNPNDALIRQIDSDPQPPLSVILTDGVQSDSPGQGNPPVVDAISEWMNKGRTFGLIVLRSDFSGPLYSERLRTWIRDGRRLTRFNIPARPFYAFAFSPTSHEFDELLGKIKRDFPEASAVVFRDDSATCQISAGEKARQPYGRSDPGRSGFLWQRFNSDLFSGSATPAELRYEVSCRFRPDYSLGELSLTADAGCHAWRGNDFDRAPARPPDGFTCELDAGDARDSSQSAPLRVAVTRDGRSEFSFYRIKVNAAVRYLRDDIRELNTEDDGDPQNGQKTYKLSSLIIALTEAHLKTRLAGRVSPALYLTIGNR